MFKPYCSLIVALLLFAAVMLCPPSASGQEKVLTKAQSKAKMEALKRLEQRYIIDNYIDSLGLAVVTSADPNGYDPYGVVALDGRVVVPAEYQWINYEREPGIFLLLGDNGRVGCANRQGRIVVPLQYENEYLMMGDIYFFNGLMPCLDSNYKYGIIDTEGRVVVPFVYDGRLRIADAGKRLMYLESESSEEMYLLRFNGDTVVGPFPYLELSTHGRVAVRIDDQWGYYDTTGRVVIPCQYDDWFFFSDGKAFVEKDGVIGIIDSTGRELVPLAEKRFEGDYATFLSPNRICLSRENKCGVVDMAGNVVIPFAYSYLFDYRDDMIVMAKEAGSLHLLDTMGRRLETYDIDYIYQDLAFSYGGIIVSRNDRWGFVDTNWQVVIPLRYKYMGQLDSSHFHALLDDGECALLDATGKVILTGPYETMQRRCNGIYSVTSYPNTDADSQATPYLQGYVDLYGNTTFSKKELERMKRWMAAQTVNSKR